VTFEKNLRLGLILVFTGITVIDGLDEDAKPLELVIMFTKIITFSRKK